MTGLPIVLACLALLIASMAALSACHARGLTSPETIRKALHVEMGLVVAGAPWLADAAWQVVPLAILACAWLHAVRTNPLLRHRFGGAVHVVSRRSMGEFYFVLGVATTYLLSTREPAWYCAAILIMALADTAAAVAGQRFGRRLYGTGAGRKSVEGSCAFFCIAFACAASVLAVLTGDPPAAIVVAALTVASVSTVVEAMAKDGSDNLLVPLSVLATLQICLDAAHISTLAVAVASFAIVAVLSREQIEAKEPDAWSRDTVL